MLSKLKYARAQIEDLLNVYKTLFLETHTVVVTRAIFSVVEALGQGPVGGPCVYIYTYDTACRCPYLYM